jgi:ceramide glucosyltransferase
MTLEPALTILALLVLIKGLVGVLDGIRYHQYVRNHLNLRPEPWMPRVSVILPCKDLDFELERNVEAVFRQVYPSFEVLVVTATADDPARPLLQRLAARYPGHEIRFVTAGFSAERGEKVNNLIQALAHADPNSEVLVFTDSDSRPHFLWLQELVAPLRDKRIGVSTGYRWYYPAPRNLASLIRSVWNGSVATLLGNHGHNFAWGGSMAIRRSTFDHAKVLSYWKHSLSDDYSITRAVQDAKLKIHYEPRCLIGSYGPCGWRELFEWSTRQMTITRIYSRKLWYLALVSQWSFVLVWWALAGAVVTNWPGPVAEKLTGGIAWTGSAWKYSVMVGLLFLFGAVRAVYRVKTIQQIHPEQRLEIQHYAWGYVLLFPIASTLTAYNLLVSAFTSSLNWRGVRYEVQSPHQMRVVQVQKHGKGRRRGEETQRTLS